MPELPIYYFSSYKAVGTWEGTEIPVEINLNRITLYSETGVPMAIFKKIESDEI